MAGNANSGNKRDKIVRDALTLAAKRVLDNDPEGRIALAVAAEKVVLAAASGDLAAFKEMADRIDGKSIQAIEQSGEVTVTHVDARARLGRKLHAIVDATAEEQPINVTH